MSTMAKGIWRTPQPPTCGYWQRKDSLWDRGFGIKELDRIKFFRLQMRNWVPRRINYSENLFPFVHYGHRLKIFIFIFIFLLN
jgi:hypothetical protein